MQKRRDAEEGDSATKSTPDLGGMARKQGSAVGKPPLQPKKTQPVGSGSPKASSKSSLIDANQVGEALGLAEGMLYSTNEPGLLCKFKKQKDVVS